MPREVVGQRHNLELLQAQRRQRHHHRPGAIKVGCMPMRFYTHVRRMLRVLAPHANAGVAAVEFAFCSTILLTAVAGTVDIGLLLYTEFELDTAVNAGAQFAANNAATVGSNPSTLNSDISSIVDNLNGTGWATSTVDVNNNNDTTGCYCPSGTSGNWTWGSTGTCGTSCPSGGGIYGQFVTVTARRSISPIFTAWGFVSAGTATRSVLVETQ
jgi:Flp pilus assembly protein TadG